MLLVGILVLFLLLGKDLVVPEKPVWSAVVMTYECTQLIGGSACGLRLQNNVLEVNRVTECSHME